MAICVGAWSRAPRAWSDLVASGQWRVPGRRFVGLLMAYAVRVAEPLRLVACEYVQTMLPGRKFQSHPGVPPARIWELGPCGYVGYLWISMDIYGYSWIYTGLKRNISDLLYWIRYPSWISIHIHRYPTFPSKISNISTFYIQK
jgi:hypothetical protein